MKRILFLVAHPQEDAGCRYRIYQFVPYLERAGYECLVSPFSTDELFRSLRKPGQILKKSAHTLYCSFRRAIQLTKLRHFDFVVIHREVFPFFTPFLERVVLRNNRTVIFSFDDAVYSGHHNPSALNHPLLYRFKYGSGADEVLKRCIHVVAGNRILAAYAQKFNSHVSILPTVVDCEYYRYRPVSNSSTVTVGWMGSRSTASYLALAEPALNRLAQAYGSKVQFRFYGHPDYKPNIPAALSLPFRLSSEIDDLHSIDIGIMPMPDTEWTRGKCAFKAIQYMATGAVTVASPVGITSDLIHHNENGLLADSSDAWFHCLSTLVRDVQLRNAVSLRARRTIEESYSLQQWAPILVSLFDQLGSKAIPRAKAAQILHQRGTNCVS